MQPATGERSSLAAATQLFEKTPNEPATKNPRIGAVCLAGRKRSFGPYFNCLSTIRNDSQAPWHESARSLAETIKVVRRLLDRRQDNWILRITRRIQPWAQNIG